MSKLRKQNNEADKKREQAEMKREDDFQRLVTLRKRVRAISEYIDAKRYMGGPAYANFGTSRWDRPAKDVLDNDESTVEDFIKALEEGVLGFKEFLKDSWLWNMDDRFVPELRLAKMQEVLALAYKQQCAIRF